MRKLKRKIFKEIDNHYRWVRVCPLPFGRYYSAHGKMHSRIRTIVFCCIIFVFVFIYYSQDSSKYRRTASFIGTQIINANITTNSDEIQALPQNPKTILNQMNLRM